MTNYGNIKQGPKAKHLKVGEQNRLFKTLRSLLTNVFGDHSSILFHRNFHICICTKLYLCTC